MVGDRQDEICECGKTAGVDLTIWNGMHHMPVCDECWNEPENIVLEACVTFAENTSGYSLEECFRLEFGFREIPWTDELQALCDKLYCEWYLEEGSNA